MTTMVEIVARAICNDLVEHWPQGDPSRPEGDDRKKYLDMSWPQYECVARAAIAAMRDPTSEMMDAAEIDLSVDFDEPGITLSCHDAKRAWQAAIDEALK